MNQNSKRPPKKLLLVAGVVVLVVVIAIYALASGHNKSKNTAVSQVQTGQAAKGAAKAPKLVSIAPSSITYPSSWQELKAIPQVDEQAGVISEATHTNPTVNVSVREVKGALAPNFNIQNLPSQVVANLQKSLNGFSLKQQGVVKIGAYEGARIEYTAPDANNVSYVNTMFIIPTPQKTFYITYQSSGQSLSQLNEDVNTINVSVSQLST